MAGIEPFFRSLPTLTDARNDLSPVRELTVLRKFGHDPVEIGRARAWLRSSERCKTPSQTLHPWSRLTAIAQTGEISRPDFSFLFDHSRKLFLSDTGTDGSLDPNCYDLLASEARLTSSLPSLKRCSSSHWFRVGAPLRRSRGSALISCPDPCSNISCPLVMHRRLIAC